MSIWNGLTEEQEAFKRGAEDAKAEKESVGAMVVSAFQSVNQNLWSPEEREAYQEGREHEINNRR